MKFILLIAFTATVLLGDALGQNKSRYDGYKVYRVRFDTDEQFALIQRLQDEAVGVDLWQISRVDRFVDVLVPPKSASRFLGALTNNGFSYRVQIENVQNLIDVEQKS